MSYRIPGVVVTNNGIVIAYCEMRNGLHDRSSMSIVYRRSIDCGRTWSDSITLADGISRDLIIDNPVMVVSSDNRIHCFYTINIGKIRQNGSIIYIYSDDDGETWSEPRDISESTSPFERGLFATGPGHGIELVDGTLVIPVWYSLNKNPSNDSDAFPSETATLYSTDNGDTWLLGETIMGSDTIINPNECTLVQLETGEVMMLMRSQTSNYLWAFSISETGFSNWTEPSFISELPGPHCFGSLLRLDEMILFVYPRYNPQKPDSRQKVSIKICIDEGKTWSREKQILSKNGGYTDINTNRFALVNNPYIYAALEINEKEGCSIRIFVFNREWLTK